MKMKCTLCPHNCSLEEGQLGVCRARSNVEGCIRSLNYGQLTAIALDPIEKKPLARFYPGSKILSVGSYGCNLRCSFCQNSDISMKSADELIEGQAETVSPEVLVKKALELIPYGNIGIAYTYNEPLIGYEYVYDCARLAKEQGLKNVVVTNGTINEQPLKELLPFIDAMNIDLKGFTERFYQSIHGDLDTVKRTIEIADKCCHVEITTLIIPGENDSDDEMDALAFWLSSVDPEIPLHVTRFFPRYHMTDRRPTPVQTIFQLADVARRHLHYVYEGNC